MPGTTSPLGVGFAAIWEDPPEPTWSYIPWNLRAALARRTDVTVADVGFTFSGWEQRVLKLAHLRSLRGRTRSTWRHSDTVSSIAARRFERSARGAGVDVVLQTTPIAAVRDRPYFVYHDAGVDALEDHRDPRTGQHPFLTNVPPQTVERIRARQRRIFLGAAGVFTFSRWLADALVDRVGVDPARITVVPPGRNADAVDTTFEAHPRSRPGAHRHRLLFVGKVFGPKGGDLVLAALARLRQQDPTVTLTIAGPPAPPVDPLPDGVEFLGRIPVQRVAALYAEHDLFVMPSRIEPFGIVFVEALAHGLPCVARNAFAMPEIIRPGENGALVDDDDPDALAAAIAGVLGDDEVFARVDAGRADVAAHYSWDRAAQQMVEVMRG